MICIRTYAWIQWIFLNAYCNINTGTITVKKWLFHSHQPYIIVGICGKKVLVSNIHCKNNRGKVGQGALRQWMFIQVQVTSWHSSCFSLLANQCSLIILRNKLFSFSNQLNFSLKNMFHSSISILFLVSGMSVFPNPIRHVNIRFSSISGHEIGTVLSL